MSTVVPRVAAVSDENRLREEAEPRTAVTPTSNSLGSVNAANGEDNPSSCEGKISRSLRCLAFALLLVAGLDLLCTALILLGFSSGTIVAVVTWTCKPLCMVLLSIYIVTQRAHLWESIKRRLIAMAHCKETRRGGLLDQVHLTLDAEHTPAWRQHLARFLEDQRWSLLVILWVMVDMCSIFFRNIAATSLFNPVHSENINYVAMWSKILSLSILFVFMVEQVLHLVAFGRVLFSKRWLVLDLAVVGFCFLSGLWECFLGEPPGGYHVGCRLWRLLAFFVELIIQLDVNRMNQARISESEEVLTPSFSPRQPSFAAEESERVDNVNWTKLLASTLVRHGIPLPAAPPTILSGSQQSSRPPSRTGSRPLSPAGSRPPSSGPHGRDVRRSDRAAFLISEESFIREASRKWPDENEADIFEGAISVPAKAKFFRHIFLAPSGGLDRIDFLFDVHRFFGATMVAACLVMNVAVLLYNNLRTVASLPSPLRLEWPTDWLMPTSLVALFELAYLGFFFVLTCKDLRALFSLGHSPKEGHQRYYRWQAVVSLLIHRVPQLRAFSALRVLYWVLPAVLIPDLQALLRDRRGVVAFVTFRLIALFFGLQAFMVRLWSVYSVLRRLDDSEGLSFWSIVEIAAFLNQMTGIVDLALFTRRRLFLFIFGGSDVILDSSEVARRRAWLATLLHRVWGHPRSSLMRFFAVALTFSPDDVQRLVLRERSDCSGAAAVDASSGRACSGDEGSTSFFVATSKREDGAG
eukprot:TRINITY_DN42495_c0_g3_i1.p1 TRINITY_DN42495_c0_g3~~TRINITY_DN42495_c0_g3_i1.p1  ORF type:complete len:751 (+),score=84.82 TRINITY_DN42495_c0_g3_i1:200-2452(+)